MTLASVYQLTNQFIQFKCDGILGLAYESMANSKSAPFFDVLVK